MTIFSLIELLTGVFIVVYIVVLGVVMQSLVDDNKLHGITNNKVIKSFIYIPSAAGLLASVFVLGIFMVLNALS